MIKFKEIFALIGAFLLGVLTLSIFKKSTPATPAAVKEENKDLIANSKEEDKDRDSSIEEAEEQLKKNEELLKKNEELLKNVKKNNLTD